LTPIMPGKPLSKLTCQELAEWIGSSEIRNKDIVKQVILDTQLTGEELCGVTKEKDLNDCGISPISSPSLLRAIASRYAQDAKDAIPKRDMKDMYSVTVVIAGKNEVITKCHKNMTVSEFKVRMNEEISTVAETIDLFAGGEGLVDSKTLDSYGIIPGFAEVQVTLRVVGGSEIRIRQLNNKNSKIELTMDKDCITWDDCKKFRRAKMPCGHAIGCYTMFEYIKSVLEKNLYSYQIRCPARVCGKQSGKECEKECKENCSKECGTEWSWQLVAAVADLSEEEYSKYTKIVVGRFENSQQIKECPSCHNKCKRDKNLTIFRTKCLGCRGPDFCWACAKLWKSGGLQICGNEGCPILKVNGVLKGCKDKKLASGDAVIPEIRACPSCLTLISHTQNCKHMTCKGCNKHFCFSCLQVYEDNGNKWNCGGPYEKCTTIAGRQVLK